MTRDSHRVDWPIIHLGLFTWFDSYYLLCRNRCEGRQIVKEMGIPMDVWLRWANLACGREYILQC